LSLETSRRAWHRPAGVMWRLARAAPVGPAAPDETVARIAGAASPVVFRGDRRRDVLSRLMFPEAEHCPARGLHGRDAWQVAVPSPLELWNPVLRVDLGDVPMKRAPVPEASSDEDGEARGREHNVRPWPAVPGGDSRIDTKAHPAGVE